MRKFKIAIEGEGEDVILEADDFSFDAPTRTLRLFRNEYISEYSKTIGTLTVGIFCRLNYMKEIINEETSSN